MAVGPWDGVNIVPRCFRGGDPADGVGGPMGNLPLRLDNGAGNSASSIYGWHVGTDAVNGFDIDAVQPPRLPPLHPPRLRRRHGRAVTDSKGSGVGKTSICEKAGSGHAAVPAPEGAQAAVAAAGTWQVFCWPGLQVGG